MLIHAAEELKKSFNTAAFAGRMGVLKKLRDILVEESGIKEENLMEIYDDAFGRNALYCALVGEGADKIALCKYLVEELKFDVNIQDDKGNTPLHASALEENCVTTAYLLDQGADPHIANEMGLFPLHHAAKRGRKDLIRLMISKGATVDAHSIMLGTPLLTAIAHDMSGAVEVLLENHANPNFGAPNSLTPLVSAIQAKSIGCVRPLLKWGADPNRASHELTPLVAAVQEGQTEIIKLLLTAGAEANTPDFYDSIPIEIAAKLGNHADVVALFPVTDPIPSIPDWTVRGILEYVHSNEGKNKGKPNIDSKFLDLKAKGAEAVKRGHYMDAAVWYTEALQLKPLEAAILSNRSLCWARLKKGDDALQDAIDCIILRKDWPKAHYRAGVAYALLRDYREAEKEFGIALKLDPESKELQDAHREAVLDLRALQMHEMKTNGCCEEFKQDEHDEAYEEYVSSLL